MACGALNERHLPRVGTIAPGRLTVASSFPYRLGTAPLMSAWLTKMAHPKRSVFWPLLLAAITAFALIVFWELWAERVVFHWAGLPFDEEFEVAERLHFILVATGAIVLSLIVPAILLKRSSARLQQAYSRLSDAQQKAQTLARHDVLTGLPNRRVFRDAVSARIRGSNDSRNAVLLIDLDRFKPVNDLHGHQVGDSVLCEVAERLKALVPQGGIVSRLGGDEFALIASHASTEATRKLAQRIITALSAPYALQTSSIGIGASIGIAVCGDDGQAPEKVLRAADLALYRAKREGRNCLRFFEAGMDREIRERAKLEWDLRDAIESGTIEPHYQPILDLQTRTVVAFEILSRWTRNGKTVEPRVFIPVIEEIGAMDKLTCGILRRACRDALQWPEEIALSLNLSPTQIQDHELPDRITAILRETSFPPARLQVEITEDALVKDLATAKRVLGSLSAIGVRLALDDYGTGYSSLHHLHELKFEKIKIDRSFIAAMSSDTDSMKIVEAILAMSASLNLRVTAEGIESPIHASWLTRQGCDEGQGYLFGQAMPAGDVLPYLARMSDGDAVVRRLTLGAA